MNLKLLSAVLAVLVAVALTPPVAQAAGRGTSATKQDPNFTAGKKAAQAGDYEKAIADLIKAVQASPKNADAYNLLGYSYKNLGRFAEAFESYAKALAINPKHRGAHEYIGEAYLAVGNLTKAEEHLKRLDSLCFFGCEEYSDLKKAIASYKAKHGA
ncbi:MAG: tetratricopeptide repeat protein [Alphaproteobacteria bacterium]